MNVAPSVESTTIGSSPQPAGARGFPVVADRHVRPVVADRCVRRLAGDCDGRRLLHGWPTDFDATDFDATDIDATDIDATDPDSVSARAHRRGEPERTVPSTTTSARYLET